jgi:transcriptional regulator with XRE-family HTH domain
MAPVVPGNDCGTDLKRRRALAEFLRSRREHLNPQRLGMVTHGRRRTPGLRREEVASRAGVGVAWYTWLEQSRDIRPSRDALLFIADALELTSVESELLLLLGAPSPEMPKLPATADVPEATRALLRHLEPLPAFVLNARRDILAWNDATERIYAISGRPPEARNSMMILFLEPLSRVRLADWESLAGAAVAAFRRSAAPFIGHPAFDALLARLRTNCDFVRLWDCHHVDVRHNGFKEIRGGAQGTLRLVHQAFTVTDRQDLTLVVYSPAT